MNAGLFAMENMTKSSAVCNRFGRETRGATASFFSPIFFVFVVAIVARFLAEVNGGKIPA